MIVRMSAVRTSLNNPLVLAMIMRTKTAVLKMSVAEKPRIPDVKTLG